MTTVPNSVLPSPCYKSNDKNRKKVGALAAHTTAKVKDKVIAKKEARLINA